MVRLERLACPMVDEKPHLRRNSEGIARGRFDSVFPRSIEEQAQCHPQRLAVQDGGHALTYAELNRRANQVAHTILAAIPRGHHSVVVLIPQGHTFICATWGIWKAGKASVPITPTEPDAILAHVISETTAGLLLCSSETVHAALRVAPAQTEIINIDEIERGADRPNPELLIAPDDVSMIVYTSGSSGMPEGVPHTHRTYLQSIHSWAPRLNIDADDRLSLLHPPGAISTQGTILCAALFGASLHPHDVTRDGPATFREWLPRQRITFFRCVPTLFGHLTSGLPPDTQFPDVRICWLGGEPVTRYDVKLWQRHFSSRGTFINNLGTTETLSFAQYIIKGEAPLDDPVVPVGYGYADKVITVCNKHGHPVPPDTLGEITVTSRFLSKGYWNRPEDTRAAFVPGPEGGAIQTYLTGDLGKLREDGCLVYSGRKDNLVKIRGLRVDTDVVESVIRDITLVHDVAVAPRETRAHSLCLVAYLVYEGKHTLRTDPLRDQLLERLSTHMVPSRFIAVDSLPLTSTGKVDRRALRKLDDAPAPAASTVGGMTSTERRLAEIWHAVLAGPPVGRSSNFFELGGDSMHAVEIVAAIEHVFNRRLPITTLIQAPTVAAQAAIIRSKVTPGPATSLVTLQPYGGLPPLFLVPPAASSVLRLRPLALRLGSTRPVYGFEPAGIDSLRPPLNRIEAMAEHYVREMRNAQPRGPYYIGGRCLGGVVAFEMAQQLHDAGERIGLVAVLDSMLPPGYTRRGLNSQAHSHRKPIMRRLTYRALKVAARIYRGVLGKQASSGKATGVKTPPRIPSQHASPDAHHTIRRAHAEARRRYIPRHYPGRITYFRSSNEGMRDAWNKGWRRLCAEIDFVDIPGQHKTILHDEHIATLAAVLQERLERTTAG